MQVDWWTWGVYVAGIAYITQVTGKKKRFVYSTLPCKMQNPFRWTHLLQSGCLHVIFPPCMPQNPSRRTHLSQSGCLHVIFPPCKMHTSPLFTASLSHPLTVHFFPPPCSIQTPLRTAHLLQPKCSHVLFFVWGRDESLLATCCGVAADMPSAFLLAAFFSSSEHSYSLPS